MKHTRKTTGFSLIEMLIVLVIMSIMMAIGMVSAPNMIRSQKTSSAKNMIRASLTQAQAYAARNHCNAGIRFQQSLDGRQYLVLVESRPILVSDEGNYNMSQRYTPVPNAKPSPMPEGMAVLRDDIDDGSGKVDAYLDSLTELRKAGTFTILFDHTGQLVTKACVCLPRLLAGPSVTVASFVKIQKSNDNIFCYPTDCPEVGLPLAADDMNGDPSYHDYSIAGLYVYEQKELNDVPVAARYSSYFGPYAGDPSVDKILINIYTGSIIENEE